MVESSSSAERIPETPVSEFAASFPCPGCSTLNRPLASWCRKCGQEISFSAFLKQKEIDLTIPQFKGAEEQRIFDREKMLWKDSYQVARPLPIPLVVGYGQIFIVCRHGRLISLAQENGKEVCIYQFSGEINSVPLLQEEKRDTTTEKRLVMGTTASIGEINLVTGKKREVKVTVRHNFAMVYRPICINGSVYRCCYDRQNNVSKVLCLSMETGGCEEICEIQGKVMQPIQLPEGKIFVIGPEGGGIVQGTEVNPIPKPRVNILVDRQKGTPVWHRGFVYLFSRDATLVKLSLSTLDFLAVGNITYTGFPRLCVDNDKIFLADSEKLAVYGTFGREECYISLGNSSQGSLTFGPGVFGRYVWACTVEGTLTIADYDSREECLRATMGNLYTQPTFCGGYAYALFPVDRGAEVAAFSVC